ncbi:MAG: ribonucleotide-diphosphate reductase [Neobacillus sp.]|nr:ribonucleotide-diphosphate reductase [Neobacillus sp.]
MRKEWLEGSSKMSERKILTTSSRGLLEDSFPYRLFQKAKRLGTWNPTDIDFSQDQKDWETLNAEQQSDILRLIAQFQAGEEAVTLDLLPLIMAIAKEGRLEEEMFLTTFFIRGSETYGIFPSCFKCNWRKRRPLPFSYRNV